jgi:drug/metabolite transporter (DMT)-like permease
MFASVTVLFLPVALWRWRHFVKSGRSLLATCSLACVRLFQGGTTFVFEKTFLFVVCGLAASVAIALLPLGLDAAMPTLPTVVDAWPWLLAVSALMLPATFLTIWPPTVLSFGRAGILFSFEIVVGVISAALLSSDPFGVQEVIGAIFIIGAAVVEVLPRQPGAFLICNESLK